MVPTPPPPPLHPTANTPQNKSLSDAFDPILSLQGIGWLTRKALGAATITQHLTHTAPTDSIPAQINIDQTVTGGLKGTTEKRTLDWQWRGHSDWLFGTLQGRSRYTTLKELGEEGKGKGVVEEDARFLVEGWAEESEKGEVMESFVDNEGSGWTGWQVWGFAEVEGGRRFVRRVVVRRKDREEVKRVRLVYDYAGEL